MQKRNLLRLLSRCQQSDSGPNPRYNPYDPPFRRMLRHVYPEYLKQYWDPTVDQQPVCAIFQGSDLVDLINRYLQTSFMRDLPDNDEIAFRDFYVYLSLSQRQLVYNYIEEQKRKPQQAQSMEYLSLSHWIYEDRQHNYQVLGQLSPDTWSYQILSRLSHADIKSARLSCTFLADAGRNQIGKWVCVATIAEHNRNIDCFTKLTNGALALGWRDGRISFWHNGKYLQTIEGHEGCRVSNLLQLKNSVLVSYGSDSKLKKWKDGQCIGSFTFTTRPYFVNELQDGTLAILASFYPERRFTTILFLWCNDTIEEIRIEQLQAQCFVELRNGILALGGYNEATEGKIAFWHNNSILKVLTIPERNNQIIDLLELKNGILVSQSENGIIRLWDNDLCIKTLDALQYDFEDTGSLRISLLELHDGSLAALREDGTLILWCGEQYNKIVLQTPSSDISWPPHTIGIIQLKNGILVAGYQQSGKRGILNLWQGTQCIQTLKRHISPIDKIIELDDGSIASIGFCDGIVKTWGWQNPPTIPVSFSSQSSGWLPWSTDSSKQAGQWFCAQNLITDHGEVTCILESRDGFLISGGMDGKIRFWRNNQCVQILDAHINKITCLLELRDGFLVSGSLDRTIKIWQNNMCIEVLEGHTGGITCLLEKPSGFLISGSDDGIIKVWLHWRCIETINAHAGGVACLGADMLILSDTFLSAGTLDKKIITWPLRGANPSRLENRDGNIFIITHTRVFYYLMLDRVGRLSCGGKKPSRYLISYSEAGVLLTNRPIISCFIELRDGTLVTGRIDNTLKIWDPFQKTFTQFAPCIQTLFGHTCPVTCLSELRDGTLVSGSADGTIKLWNKRV